MKTYICESCGTQYTPRRMKPKKYFYCQKPECKRVMQRRRQKDYNERLRKKRKKQKKVQIFYCENCGDMKDFTDLGYGKLKYYYCQKPECQELKVKARRNRNSPSTMRWRKKVEHRNVYHEDTGRKCVKCHRPIKRIIDEYMDDETRIMVRFVRKENHRYCDRCDTKNKIQPTTPMYGQLNLGGIEVGVNI